MTGEAGPGGLLLSVQTHVEGNRVSLGRSSAPFVNAPGSFPIVKR